MTWDIFCSVFFFKQKTAYEMRISDWSSDVCSSDLPMACLQATPSQDRATIDFTINRPPSEGSRRQFSSTLASLSKRSDLAQLLGHQPSMGQPAHRMAGAAWIARTGWNVEPERVVLTNGVQHGLAVVLAALARPGDLVLTEEDRKSTRLNSSH